ncbi:hypothetical protein M408DRAFT_98493 [Serendipita vermifera MAFF 305830]|uniref:Uncharacterized protein n=1 Tax=Serendipita vermifera MAFF 305830 TaxID=933852 RepID=A0A0C3AZE4_SERVB|nr:hypothetical protein M408DRAFT_98493 [Serendipita vermifera MAFF 305830]
MQNGQTTSSSSSTQRRRNDCWVIPIGVRILDGCVGSPTGGHGASPPLVTFLLNNKYCHMIVGGDRQTLDYLRILYGTLRRLKLLEPTRCTHTSKRVGESADSQRLYIDPLRGGSTWFMRPQSC